MDDEMTAPFTPNGRMGMPKVSRYTHAVTHLGTVAESDLPRVRAAVREALRVERGLPEGKVVPMWETWEMDDEGNVTVDLFAFLSLAEAEVGRQAVRDG